MHCDCTAMYCGHVGMHFVHTGVIQWLYRYVHCVALCSYVLLYSVQVCAVVIQVHVQCMLCAGVFCGLM